MPEKNGDCAVNALTSQIKVIDTDTHIVEPYDLWTSRISVKKYGDAVPHVRWDSEMQEDTWYFGKDRVATAAGIAMALWPKFPPSRPPRIEDAHPRTWRVEDRLKTMDEAGIYAQVLYPNIAGFGSGQYLKLEDRELMYLCVAAYNDWLVEYASAAPKRLIPLMALPFWDMEATLKEMVRAAKLGHKGIVMCGEPDFFGMPRLTSPHWDPLWAQAQDMNLSINFHIGTGDQGFREIMDDSVTPHAKFASQGILLFLSNAQVLDQIIVGGICHRFPRLKFVSVESGVGWLPFALESMDWQWKNSGVREEHPEYKLLPSEFFKRQIYGCFWFERNTLDHAIQYLGADNIMYETDFPHPTCMYPGPATTAIMPSEYIEQSFEPYSRDVAEKILYGNAARVYNMD
jgi:predicted TIM-barrel fold metal-dependent hydrolase